MAVLSWGKPTIKLVKLSEAGVPTGPLIDVYTPVDGSTKLTPTAGAKKEAPVEGGGNEAVKYQKNTYVFEYEVRAAKGRTKPLTDIDGVIDGEYGVYLQPEDVTVEGIFIKRSSVSMLPSFDTANGKKWKYSHEVLVPEDGTESIKDMVVDFAQVVPANANSQNQNSQTDDSQTDE